MWHYRSVHGPGISGVPRRSGSWRTASGKSRMKIFYFPAFFQIFFRILLDFSGFFSGFWQLLFWAARTWTWTKNLPQIFSSQKTTKNNIIIMLLHTYLLQIVQKNWMKKEKRSCFDFFVMLRVISWSAIYISSDCTVLHKIKRRKIVQALSPRIFLSTVDKIIGTKYICTKYVDRNYNIHLQNTTTLLPIIQELFFHVIIFFCPAQIKNIYCFSQKKYQLKNVFKNKTVGFFN